MGAPPGPDPRISSFEASADEPSRGVSDRALRTRRIAAAVSVVGAAIALGLVAAGPLAKSIARSRAAALGLAIDVRSSSLGFGFVRLRDVSVAAAALPSVAATLDRIDVYPGFGLGAPRVVVHGGHVDIRGSRDEIEHELDVFKSRRTAPASSGSGRGAAIVADGIDVAWSGAADSKEKDYAWGLRYARGADGTESLGVDLVQAAMAGIDVRLSRGLVSFRRENGRRILTSASTEQITGTIRLGSDDDSQSAARSADPNPTTAASRRGERLRAELDRAVSTVSGAIVAPGKIELSGARLTVLEGSDRLNIGPASVALERDSDSVKISLVPAERDVTTPVRFEAKIPVHGGPVDVDLVGGPVSLGTLGVKEGDMGLRDVDRAEVEVGGHARWSEDGSSVAVSGRSRFSDVALYHPKLAPEPVRGVSVSFDGDGTFALDGSRADLGKVAVALGKVKLEMRGTLERRDGFARGSLHAEVPLAACSDVLASAPPALVPLLTGLEVTGTLAFSGDLEFDTRRPGNTRITWDAANDCRVTRVPDSLSPDRFRRSWVRTVLGADGAPVSLESGPGTDDWVPLADISPYMQTAIVVCEDSRFFQHGGFDVKSIQDSIRNNLRAGEFVRGASTVSMQLAKNLYLGREKTLSRKLQEAVLTLLLEQSLTKEQILELYLNVIEFAPGVYGIGPAASYYFRSLPKDISLGQALYLGSILPNPKNRHFMPDGALSDTWSEYLRKLMVISHKIRRIDDHELAVGLAETVRFGTPADPTAARGVMDDGSTVAPPDDGYSGPDGP